MTDVLKLCNDNHVTPEEMSFSPESLGKIIKMVADGKINRKSGKAVLEKVFVDNVNPEEYVEKEGLAQVSDTSAIEPVIAEVLSKNEKAVTEYLGGREKNFGFLVGQSMRALGGKADPQAVRGVLTDLLNGMK